MPVLGITGGVATGKTSFTQALHRLLPGEVFDADACARELLTSDAKVRQAVRDEFGAEVFTSGGEIDRAKLRQKVFNDPASRRALEAILHPAIRSRWRSLAGSTEKKDWLMVDIPLLFETGAEAYFDSIVVVACSLETQLHRLTHLRSLTTPMAEKFIAAQMPLRTKIERAQHLIWNDASPRPMDSQAAMLASILNKRYG